MTAFFPHNSYDISGYPYDMQTVCGQWLAEIDLIIDEIIKSIDPSIIHSQKNQISHDRINKTFWQNYKKKQNWQGLLYKVQAFHWLKASYKGEIAPQYINRIGNTLLDNFENDIKKLAEIKNLLPISIKLSLDYIKSADNDFCLPS